MTGYEKPIIIVVWATQYFQIANWIGSVQPNLNSIQGLEQFKFDWAFIKFWVGLGARAWTANPKPDYLFI